MIRLVGMNQCSGLYFIQCYIDSIIQAWQGIASDCARAPLHMPKIILRLLLSCTLDIKIAFLDHAAAFFFLAEPVITAD